MPNLPDLPEVTQEQHDRILAAYQNDRTTREEAFREDVLAYVVGKVIELETQRLQAEQMAAVAELRAQLPSPPDSDELARQELIALQLDALNPNTPPHPVEQYPPSQAPTIIQEES